MKAFTAHLHDGRPPILLREGWSWGAAIFGPLWLLGSRAWVPAVLELAALVAAALLLPPTFARPVLGGAIVLNGLLGRDLVRWSLERRGYALATVVLAADRDAALLRLLGARPDLLDRAR